MPQSEKPGIHPDREQLFGNEAFVIGMLQAVAGGSIVAAISQLEVIAKYAGKISLLVFLTLMSLGLLATILAAYWRHQYKMWDVKRCTATANRFLKAMRWSMLAAVILVVVGIVLLVGAFW